MSIPLVQNNEKDSINTSIIAIKRQIKRINALLGLSNSEEIDTSVFATKDELQQAVTDLQPVDEVTADNMHSVTSNAVAQKISSIGVPFEIIEIEGFTYSNIQHYAIGNLRFICGKVGGTNLSNGIKLFNLKTADLPVYQVTISASAENSTTKYPCVVAVRTNGRVDAYHNGTDITGVFFTAIYSVT